MGKVVGSGFESVDRALGGFVSGDNVVWVCDDDRVYETLAAGFAREAVDRGAGCLHVCFSTRASVVEGATRLDASAASKFSRPVALTAEIERRVHSESLRCLVVDSLHVACQQWGMENGAAFLERVCPAMFDAGVTAYWAIDSSLGEHFSQAVRATAQCVVDVRGGHLCVVKAEGRPYSQRGIRHRLHVEGGLVTVTMSPAHGRLAQGLSTLRRDLHLTQRRLAAIGGVTGSAISQAESGTRGLSIETLMTIADSLGVTLDRLVDGRPDEVYRLARRDRSPRLSKNVVFLASDKAVGLRALFVTLPGGASEVPTVEHTTVQMIVVVRGLVQIDLGEDHPVLRAGDSLVIESTAIRSWRNLHPETASFYRILRD